MMNLLSANFFSMIRSKRFWMGAVLMLCMTVTEVRSLRSMMEYADSATIDNTIINCAPWLFILLPCVCGLFINTDYHDGTIRNKITVGRSRNSVYLSNFITVYLVAIFYLALGVLTGFIAGWGIPVLDPANVAGRLGLLLALFLALTAIAVFTATLINNRSVLVITALVGLGMMFGGQMVNGMLENPKESPDYHGVTYITSEDGSMSMKYLDKDGNAIDPEDIAMIPNPNYIDEPLRTVLRTFNEIHPGGQLWEIMYDGHLDFDEEGNTIQVQAPGWQLLCCSLGVALGFTLLGMVLFSRKDLK